MLAGLDIEFEVRTVPGIDESYPETLRLDEVPLYIARKRRKPYISSMPADELLITADTVVWASGEILGKPKTARMPSPCFGSCRDVRMR